MNNDQSRRSIPWFAVLLVIVAVFAFIQIANEGRNDLVMYGVSESSAIIPPSEARTMGVGSAAPSISPALPPMEDIAYEMDAAQPQAMRAVDSMKIAPAPYPPYYQGGTPNANDTREFNKIYYNASLQTRDVPGLTKLVETTVRGNGGRTDQVNSSDKSGYVRFVIPQTKFEAFRDQLESFVDSRFLSVNIDSQNMLGQKQAIEQQQDYTKMNIEQLNTSRKLEMSSYASTKGSLQAQIDANDRETAMLNTSLQTATEAARPNIASRLMELAAENANLRSQLKALERSHLSAINAIDAQIRYANGNADALDKQDQNLIDDVATVSGTVSIRWISLWEIAHTYLPGYWIPAILLVLAYVAHWWHRRKESHV